MKGKKLETWKNQHLQVLTNRFEVFKNGFKIFENRFLAVEKSVQKTTILGSDFQYSQWSTAVLTYIIVKYILWRTQNRWKQNCRRLPLWIIVDFWKSEKSDFPTFSFPFLLYCSKRGRKSKVILEPFLIDKTNCLNSSQN